MGDLWTRAKVVLFYLSYRWVIDSNTLDSFLSTSLKSTCGVIHTTSALSAKPAPHADFAETILGVQV